MKTISQDDYLRALALFTLANDLYSQMRRAEHTLVRHLGQEDQGCVSDLIYRDDEPASIAQFDVALKNDGIAVETGK